MTRTREKNHDTRVAVLLSGNLFTHVSERADAEATLACCAGSFQRNILVANEKHATVHVFAHVWSVGWNRIQSLVEHYFAPQAIWVDEDPVESKRGSEVPIGMGASVGRGLRLVRQQEVLHNVSYTIVLATRYDLVYFSPFLIHLLNPALLWTANWCRAIGAETYCNATHCCHALSRYVPDIGGGLPDHWAASSLSNMESFFVNMSAEYGTTYKSHSYGAHGSFYDRAVHSGLRLGRYLYHRLDYANFRDVFIPAGPTQMGHPFERDGTAFDRQDGSSEYLLHTATASNTSHRYEPWRHPHAGQLPPHNPGCSGRCWGVHEGLEANGWGSHCTGLSGCTSRQPGARRPFFFNGCPLLKSTRCGTAGRCICPSIDQVRPNMTYNVAW